MTEPRSPILILMADDDPDDCLMVKEALAENRIHNELDFVADGEQLMAYLHRRGAYVKIAGRPLPGIILLDLNMPRMDGREAIAQIKSDPNLRHIPIVVLTTSKAEEDIFRSYDLGVNSYVTKPVTFAALVDVIKTVGKYWIEIVELPPPRLAE